MSLYTASLVAQDTSVYLCDIVKPRGADEWFANVISGYVAGNTFGTGTVTYSVSLDGGTTKVGINQDGTATAATQTAAGTINLRFGWPADNINEAKLYASIATATNPVVNIAVMDNR